MSKPTIRSNYISGESVAASDLNQFTLDVKSLWDNPNQAGVLEFPEMSISHVNGVADVYAGVNTMISGSILAANDGSGGIILTPSSPNWKSLEFPAALSNLMCYTNIVASDLLSGGANGIEIIMAQAYLIAPTSSTEGTRIDLKCQNTGFNPFSDPTIIAGTSPNGAINSPPLVSDKGTFFGGKNQDLGVFPIAGWQIGIGGTYSRYYFTFTVSIPASAATKTYKFKFYLSYE